MLPPAFASLQENTLCQGSSQHISISNNSSKDLVPTCAPCAEKMVLKGNLAER